MQLGLPFEELGTEKSDPLSNISVAETGFGIQSLMRGESKWSFR